MRTRRFQLAWHDVAVDRFFLDPDHREPFTGVIEIENQVAVAADGETYEQLYAWRWKMAHL